jgi:hypothetical protein
MRGVGERPIGVAPRQSSRPLFASGWNRMLALLGVLLCGGCGGDFLLIINTGTVVADADCGDGGGSFELRGSGGLTVLVIVTSDTAIVFASGGGATCDDIIANTAVAVRGTEGDGTIRAERIRLGAARASTRALASRGPAAQGPSTPRKSTNARSV